MARTEVFHKDEVLRKVIALFWDKGYNGTSMQMITEATGLNRSSIYNSFGSKMELYQLALKTYQKESGSLYQKALLKAKNPLEALQYIFKDAVRMRLEDSEKNGCFVLNCKSEMAGQDRKISKWLEDIQDDGIDFYRELVEQAQEQGLVNKEESANAYAVYLFSAFQGLTMTGILIKDKQTLTQIINTVFKPLL